MGVGLAVVLVAAACGGSGGDGGSASSDPPAAPAAGSGDDAGAAPAPAPGDPPPAPAAGDTGSAGDSGDSAAPRPASGDDDASATPPAPASGDPSPPPPPAGDAGDTGSGDTAAPAASPAPPAAEPAAPPPAPVAAAEPVAEPVYGGTLVFGLEAETGQGWNPATTQCANPCHTVMRAIFDPLVIEGTDGLPEPYLLESFVPNDDFSVWTLRLRAGINFHDGTPVNAAALALHFDNLRTGTLSSQLWRRVLSWQPVDDLSVEVTADGPFAGLPALLTGQLGYLAAPSQYADEDGAANPVGTGPFAFTSWAVDRELVVDRNPSYWKTDGQGRQLPYLDRIIFRPIPDQDARELAMETGDLDVHHINSPLKAPEYREKFKVVEEGSFFQTSYIMLHSGKPPFDDVRARRALAHCTDTETYKALRTAEGVRIANGPFGPNTPGWLADSGFPTYDPEAGRALWSQIPDPGPIELATTINPANRVTTELLAQMWKDCGIDTQIVQADQGTAITNAILGLYPAILWRNHNGASLEVERSWWHSEYTTGLALNFGRITDPDLDAALEAASRTTDPAELRALAEEINRIFAAQVYNVWLNWSLWMLPHQHHVHNLAKVTLPDGGEILNLLEGRSFITETWVE